MLRILILTGLAAVAAAEGERNVILLGRTQLLGDAAAFPAFCEANAGKKRGALRAEVVARLKEIAREEQKAILEGLGHPEGARSLWVVNAVAVRLEEAAVKKAEALRSVRWVYPAGPMRVAANPRGVAEVLQPAPRPEFTTRKKKIPWNVDAIGAPDVWNKRKILGAGAVVAMLDAGVDYRHADLRGNVWINPGEVANNGKDDDGNGLVDDLYGFDFTRMQAEILPLGGQHHGTFTSSVVAGDGTGGTITGVAPRARLMILRANGPYNAARAFEYALDHGADIMSMSFSIPGLGHTRGLWRLMAEHATCAGLVLVSGAGNFPNVKVPEQIRIPEGIPCVICAGGVTKKRKFARFTSRGPVEWGSVKFYEDHPLPKGLIKPDVCAFPGPGIGLVAPQGGYMPDNNGKRGNSLSAPHVAGVCALVLSAAPDVPAWRVKEILEETAKDLPPRGKDPRTGAGLVDALAAVDLALEK